MPAAPGAHIVECVANGEQRAPLGTVVVVEDDRGSAALVRGILENEGYAVELCGDGRTGLATLAASLPDVVCVDLGLPDMDGLDLIAQIRGSYRHVPVVVLTGNDQIESVVAAMRAGAYDYLVKPVDRPSLVKTVRNAGERHAMAVRLSQLEREAAGTGYRGIVGTSPSMKALYRELDQVAATDITVLIHGESGTGKELVARAIHDHSARRDRPFVAVNCAAIPETLHEAEFFGHEKGAFTGAANRAPGRFEQAHTGTLFLDEVAELSASLQSKLLRVLQERRFHRVGGSSEVQVDVRLVAASHRDLGAEVRAGRFREDLFFRIAVFELELPPLRARGDDVALLAQFFATRFADELGRSVEVSPGALERLLAYDWPGNVRELQNAVQRAAVSARDGVIRPEHLPARVVRGALAGEPPAAPPPAPAAPAAAVSLDELERVAVIEAVARANGNLTQVARELGIGRTTLYRKLKRYGL